MNYTFDELYSKLLNGEITCEEASNMMKTPEVRSVINTYLNKDRINKLIPYFEEDIQNINMIINIAQFIYNNSGIDTGMSDTEYDTLYAIMLSNGGSDIISVPVTPSSNRVEHHIYTNLRGTLSKVFYLTEDEERTNPSRRYLDEWISSMENKLYNITGKKYNLNNEDVYVFPKFDGVSGIFEMDENGNIERVLTRGYTETNEAENITHQFKGYPTRKFNEFPKRKYGLKTEVMMSEKDLAYYNEKYNKDYKNTRSIVSAILNSDEYDPDKSALLHVVPLRVGLEDGTETIAEEAFKNYPYLVCRLNDREAIRNFALNHKYVNDGLRTDGAVIYIKNPEIQKLLGRENHKNNFEVAYKFTEESALTTLVDITFTMGLFGRLTPVAKVKPVKLKGNTIENISLGSVRRFKELNLGKGDIIKVLYDIIPYLAFDEDCSYSDNARFELPDECVECGGELEFSESGDIASCTNSECPCRIKGRILNYLNKMNIDGLSYGIIDKLYEYDFVTNILDLYKIEKNIKEISQIEGFGVKSVTSWIDSINAHIDVYDYVLLGALGIEGVSKKTFEKILSHMSMESLLDVVKCNDVSELINIPGIQEKTAVKIINGITQNYKTINKLEKYLNIITSFGNNDKAFSVCFTKIRDADKEKFIIENNGVVSDSLTKNTTFLVVPSLDISSSKVSKAKKYGIPVIHIDDLESTIYKYLKG